MNVITPSPIAQQGGTIDIGALARRINLLEAYAQDPNNVTFTGGTLGGASVVGVPKSANLANSIWRGKSIGDALWPDGAWTNVYGTNSRKRYTANRASGFVRLVYVNGGGQSGAGGDLPATGPMTVRASIEVTNGGNRQRVYFNGQIDGEVSPGGILVSDPVPAYLISQQNFWVWTYAAGQNLQFMDSTTQPTTAAWGEGCDAVFNAAQSDKTLSGAVTATSNLSHISPIAVVGDVSPSLAMVGLFGDSIAAGLGDVAAPLATGRGFLRRAMNNTVPFVSLALTADTYAKTHYIRYGLAQGCTDIIDEMGINDVQNSVSLATLQANMVLAWQSLGAFGARVWRTTLMPRSTSTDSWATVVNQTANANDAVRTGVNDWIRDGAPVVSTANLTAVAVGTVGALRAGAAGHPLSGYFETADTVESSRNSGKWTVGTVYIPDSQGVHPSSAGCVLAAAVIDTTRFTP